MRAVETVLHRHAEDGDRPLVEAAAADGATVSYSYREVTRAARGLADRLAAAVPGRGSARKSLRVGIVCGTTPEFVVAELALLALRATGCPVPPGASARTAAALLAAVDAVVVDAGGRDRLAAWRRARVLPEGRPVIPLDTIELAATAAGPYRTPADPHDWICKVFPASSKRGTGAQVGIRAHAVAALLDSLRAEVPAGTFARCAVTVPLGAPVQSVAATPLTLLDRGCLILPPPDTGPVPPRGWHRAVRPTTLAVTPALAVSLIADARAARREGTPIPSALFGTAEVPLLWSDTEVPESLLRELDGLGLPVYTGYGLPENTGVVSWNTPGARRVGTAGRPLAHVRAGIGPDGELLVSGAALAVDLTPGDWRSGRAVTDGWLHTGVRAMIDADGYVHLLRPAPAEDTGEPVSPEVGRLLYSLVRSMRPACVVAYGGVPDGALEALAAGVRANCTGRVSGYLPHRRSAIAARTRLATADLTEWAEIRDADLHEIGRGPAGPPLPVDLALLDCPPGGLLPALAALERRMRPGTIVLAVGPTQAGPYLDRVRDGSDYLSIALPIGAGLEVSTRLTPAPATGPFRPHATRPSAPSRQPSGE